MVSLESDTQQQAFPLAELDCKGHDMDPTLVYFLPREILPSDFMQVCTK